MTPAEELAAAADKLDALIADAAPDWKLSDDNHLALPMIEMPHMIGPKIRTSSRYTVAGPNDATTLFIAAMNPLVGKALAEMLRTMAALASRLWSIDERILADALALARLINGTTS